MGLIFQTIFFFQIQINLQSSSISSYVPHGRLRESENQPQLFTKLAPIERISEVYLSDDDDRKLSGDSTTYEVSIIRF